MTKGTPRGSSPRRAARVAKAEQPAASTQHEKPLFCFERTLRNGDERWTYTFTAEDALELLGFISEMARLTWAEIERQQTGGQNRHRKHHDQPVETLCKEAQDDLSKAKLGEIFGDTIFRFRLSGEKRLWGFREECTFHVVLWDPAHAVCPVDQ